MFAGRTRWVVVVGDRMLDDTGAVIGTSGFYVDVTDSLQSDISNVLSAVVGARANRAGEGRAHGRLRRLRGARV